MKALYHQYILKNNYKIICFLYGTSKKLKNPPNREVEDFLEVRKRDYARFFALFFAAFFFAAIIF